MTKTYHIHTFGCQMNVADSGHVAAQLEALGYQPVDRPETADVIVINTCVVRQSAEDKALGKLGSLLPIKRRRPDTVIGLMGCLVGIKPNPRLAQRFPWVDVFMPPSEPGPLVGFLTDQELTQQARAIEDAEVEARHILQDGGPSAQASRKLPGRSHSVLQSVRHLSRNGQATVSAHVPVVYGCSHACTFCIIPFRRGVERSRPLPEIVAEVRDLVQQGVREVTLLGQIVDRYGYDFSGHLSATNPNPQGPDLADLLQAVSDVEGLLRIRFLTSHPLYMNDRLLQAVRDLPKVCEHIEVPIQAGDDTVLANMRRGYTAGEYRQLVQRIRDTIPSSAIHTDVIVGFPGETEEQFARTYDILAELKLDKAHLARYSPRPGTVSARRMDDDVADEVKIERHRSLEQLQADIQREINSRLVGQTVEVLVEDQHKGKWRGRTRQNKLVFFSDPGDWRGELAQVQVTWAGPYSMQGRLATPPPVLE